MNVLIDELPTEVEIDGEIYKLKTDFRYSLQTILAFEDPELTSHEKGFIMLQNLFEKIPDNVEEAVEKAQWFLNGGQSPKEEHSRRLYMFSKDAGFIFSAFSATHSVDLQSSKLHWWKFLTLFMDLGQSTTFCEITALRKRYYQGKCTKEEKKVFQEMKDILEIPEDLDYTDEEKKLLDTVQQNYKKAKAIRDASKI